MGHVRTLLKGPGTEGEEIPIIDPRRNVSSTNAVTCSSRVCSIRLRHRGVLAEYSCPSTSISAFRRDGSTQTRHHPGPVCFGSTGVPFTRSRPIWSARVADYRSLWCIDFESYASLRVTGLGNPE
jgi:hypothetical protein